MTIGARTPRPRLRSTVQLLLIVFVAYVFVVPQLGGAREALDIVAGVDPALVALAVGLQAAAILSYALVGRLLLPAGNRPGLVMCFGVALASLGVRNVVPGGAATTAAVNYRLLGLAGVPRPALGFALATQAIGSAVVLNLLLWGAVGASIPTSGFHPIYLTAALVGVVSLVVLGLAVGGLLRGRDRMARVVGAAAGHLPAVNAEDVDRVLAELANQLRALGSDRTRLASGIGLAAGNWMLEAGALWVMLAAFGHRAEVVGLFVAFGLSKVMAAIPVTPGGLGVVEAVLIPTLVGFGTPASVAAVGVVAYRLVSFWLPIPVGLSAYLIVERTASSPPAGGPGGMGEVEPGATARRRF